MVALIVRWILVLLNQPDGGGRCAVLRQELRAPCRMVGIDRERSHPEAAGIARTEATVDRRNEGANQHNGGFLPECEWIAAFAYVVEQRGDSEIGRGITLCQHRAQDVAGCATARRGASAETAVNLFRRKIMLGEGIVDRACEKAKSARKP